MSLELSRRTFVAGGLTAAGFAGQSALAAEEKVWKLPTVRWGEHEISRLLVGHNPIKGISHRTAELNREMRGWFSSNTAHGLELLARCEALGINACQMGFRPTEQIIANLLREHADRGGQLKWIATFYSLPQDRESAKQELAGLLMMTPRPIGIQQVGNTTDLLMRQGNVDQSLENLKRFRDAGLLVGLCSHNHEVIDYAESRSWDVDFYQCCLYRSAFDLDATKRGREMYEEAARHAMTQTIRRVSKPCIAFKVLAASRHCDSVQQMEAAFRYAYENIKPSDVVLVGMWQKYRDQVAQNTALVRKILTTV